MENESPGQLVNLLEVQNKQLVASWRTLCICLYSVCAVGNCCLSFCLNVGRLWEGCEKHFASPGKSRTFSSFKLWKPCNRLLALLPGMSWSRNQRLVIRTKKCSLSHVSKSLVLVLGLVLGLLCSEYWYWQFVADLRDVVHSIFVLNFSHHQVNSYKPCTCWKLCS